MAKSNTQSRPVGGVLYTSTRHRTDGKQPIVKLLFRQDTPVAYRNEDEEIAALHVTTKQREERQDELQDRLRF